MWLPHNLTEPKLTNLKYIIVTRLTKAKKTLKLYWNTYSVEGKKASDVSKLHPCSLIPLSNTRSLHRFRLYNHNQEYWLGPQDTHKQLKTHQGINMHWIQIRTKDISDSAFEYFLSIQSSWQLTLSLSVTVICHLSKALWTNRALNPFFVCPSPFSGKCLYIDQKLFTSNIMQSSFKKYPRETVNTILCNLPKIDCSLSNCTC